MHRGSVADAGEHSKNMFRQEMARAGRTALGQRNIHAVRRSMRAMRAPTRERPMRSAMFDSRILPDEPYAEKLVTLRRGRKPPPEGEDARGRFVRLVTKRAKAALTELRLIGNPREPRLQLVSAGDRGTPSAASRRGGRGDGQVCPCAEGNPA